MQCGTDPAANLEKAIAFIRDAYKLPSRYERLRRRGMLTTREIAAQFDVSDTAVHAWEPVAAPTRNTTATITASRPRAGDLASPATRADTVGPVCIGTIRLAAMASG